MYESFYNLNDDPFRLSPDPHYCLKHRSYEKAEGYLRYGVQRAEGIVMITGAPGTGKSTLISDLMAGFPPSKAVIGTLVVTRLETDDLFRAVAYAFNLAVEGMDRASVLRCLELFLAEQAQRGKRALLVVDEAQNLANDQLEDLRLLTNLQVGKRPLLQVFLLGQEELREKVQDSSLKQLHQRIIAACHLQPLESDETRAYIEYRLGQAGWKGNPGIMDEAFLLLHEYSGGIPRCINQLCSRLLLYGSVDRKHVLDVQDVQTVFDDFLDESLFPAREWPGSEAVKDAYAHARSRAAYRPRVVTTSDRPARTPAAEKDDTRSLALRANMEDSARGGDASPRVGQGKRSHESSTGRSEAAKPRLKSISVGSVNEALKALADDDDVPSVTATRPQQDEDVPRSASRSEPTEAADPAAGRTPKGPSLYADPWGERRGPGPSSMRARTYEDDDNWHDHGDDRSGKGRLWLTALAVIALLLTSAYVASPLIEDQLGVDIAAIVDEQVAAVADALSSTPPPTDPATQQSESDRVAPAAEGAMAEEPTLKEPPLE